MYSNGSSGNTKYLQITRNVNFKTSYIIFKEGLKPKLHFLTHYPRIMMEMCPLKHVSCMRFEAKHKEIKQSAKVVTS